MRKMRNMRNTRKGDLREHRFCFIHVKVDVSGRHLGIDPIENERKDQVLTT